VQLYKGELDLVQLMQDSLEDDVAVVYDKVGGNFKALNGDKVAIERALQDSTLDANDVTKAEEGDDVGLSGNLDITIDLLDQDAKNKRNSSLLGTKMHTTSGIMYANGK